MNQAEKAQGRVRHDLVSSQAGESLHGVNTCDTCGRPCARKYCSVACYRTSQRSTPLELRFWARVKRTNNHDSCWLWHGSVAPNGYGQLHVVQRPGVSVPVGAHRIAWELAAGPIPAGMSVLHRCDVKRCCNVRHLFLGTHTDNMRDASAKGRLSVPRPNRRKVTDADIEEMKAMRRSGLRLVQIAAHFNVTKSFVSMAVRGRRRAPLRLSRTA